MFDAIVREVEQRFGFGDKAQTLIVMLLATLFNSAQGGIEGFFARLQQQGFAELLASWRGNNQPAPVDAQQLESLLGASTLSAIAERLGVARGSVVAAASVALPKLIGLLTPDGHLPVGVPAEVRALVGLPIAASSTIGATDDAYAPPVTNAENPLAWIKWLLLAAILLTLSYCVLTHKPADNAASTNVTPAASNPATKPSVTQAAVADAKTALLALLPGKYTVDDLVKALNLMTIHFDTGSATINSDSLDILSAAANALKAAPAGSKVEIGGHTDNSGDAATNLKVSDDRANAVRNKLIELGVAADELSAKGYGDTVPVADNASEDGRAKNRRMAFTVLH
jgi:outer membrane protein OmpA-like peptidoglycan-associated protein/uncharacterized protein YidB (DUF937 family)